MSRSLGIVSGKFVRHTQLAICARGNTIKKPSVLLT
jgi:hypothetical protein